jgi:hypothetical protein
MEGMDNAKLAMVTMDSSCLFCDPFGFDKCGQFDVQSTRQFVVLSFLFGGFGIDIVGLRSEYSLPNGFVMKLLSRGGFGTSSKDIYNDEEFFIQSQQFEMCVGNKNGYNKQYNDYAASAAYSPKSDDGLIAQYNQHPHDNGSVQTVSNRGDETLETLTTDWILIHTL